MGCAAIRQFQCWQEFRLVFFTALSANAHHLFNCSVDLLRLLVRLEMPGVGEGALNGKAFTELTSKLRKEFSVAV